MDIETLVIKAKEGDNTSLENLVKALTPLIIKERKSSKDRCFLL